MQATLVRTPLAISAPDVLTENLLKQASVCFRYRGFSVKEDAQQLAQLLDEAQIVPFDEESVKRYQWDRRLSPGIRRISQVLWGVSLATLLLLVTEMLFFVFHLGTFAAIVVLGIATGFLGFAIRDESRAGTRWVRRSLGEVELEIPLFVLQTAVSVKGRHPRAWASVEILERNANPSDPFLVVGIGKAHAYVEVWDEPGFEARRRL